MVENVRLFALVHVPSLFPCEEIDLYGKTVCGGFLLGDDDVETAVDIRVIAQVMFYVHPVELYVCRKLFFRTVILDCAHPRRLRKNMRHRRYGFAEIDHHFLRADFKGVEVHEYLLVNPASFALLHSAPVLEHCRHECVWRYHRESVVPVADLYRVEGDLLDIAVGAAVRELDPVSYMYHVVLRQLYAGYESQDAVLEDQHKHGGGGSQTGQQDCRGLVDGYGYDDYAADEIQYDLKPLDKPVKRMTAVLFRSAVYVQKDQQHGIGRRDYCHDHEHDVRPVENAYHVVALFIEHIWHYVNCQPWNQENDVASEMAFGQIWMPSGPQETYAASRNPSVCALEHPVYHHARQYYGRGRGHVAHEGAHPFFKSYHILFVFQRIYSTSMRICRESFLSLRIWKSEVSYHCSLTVVSGT